MIVMHVEGVLVSRVCLCVIYTEHEQWLFTVAPFSGKMIPAELESSIVTAKEKVRTKHDECQDKYK